jgi:hypothetical protein
MIVDWPGVNGREGGWVGKWEGERVRGTGELDVERLQC